jgi:pyruvate/2-oxoglutarate dehydrogenase complex dihydrolipoamide acyltransferase (E2) component
MRRVASVVVLLTLSFGAGAVAAQPAFMRLAQAAQPSAPAPEQSKAPPAAAPAPAATTPAPAAAPPAAAASTPLTGLAAWNQLIGNSITGEDSGKTLTEYYAADGTAKSMTGDEISRGTWMLAGEVICFKYTDEPKPECYRVEVQGDTATYYDEKGSGTRYRIVKGNPKNL